MPELPEVETIKRGLKDLIVRTKIIDITTDSAKQVLPSLEIVKKAVVGSTIKSTDRRAKLLQLHLSNSRTLVFHLKLTGRLLVRKAGEPKDEWEHVTIKLKTQSSKLKTTSKNSKLKDGDLELRFCDARKFGWVKLINNQSELEKLLSGFGPEPLNDLTLEKFKKILTSSSRPVKVILMDQAKISGIGNIYVCDSLFLAGIDPRRPAKNINASEAEKLFEAIEKVLKLGLKYRGASDQYYLDATGHKGEYQNHFLVYGRKGEDCSNKCGGQIKRIVVGGRGTFFCPRCQR